MTNSGSTGYQWYPQFDKNMVELIKDEFLKSNNNHIGASGRRVFTFKTLKSGQPTITFERKRSWEYKKYTQDRKSVV